MVKHVLKYEKMLYKQCKDSTQCEECYNCVGNKITPDNPLKDDFMREIENKHSIFDKLNEKLGIWSNRSQSILDDVDINNPFSVKILSLWAEADYNQTTFNGLLADFLEECSNIAVNLVFETVEMAMENEFDVEMNPYLDLKELFVHMKTKFIEEATQQAVPPRIKSEWDLENGESEGESWDL